ncbi:MAG: molybdenum cofactor biosynthesis protein MoaE [Bacteroidetes bacterium]|nr:MAG: molybdenum cofactor biosynthesis protein MoaE [Bacteroidota bacterium]
MSLLVHITNLPIDTEKVINLVKTDSSGAVNVFIGTVRNSTKNKEVVGLEFESYESMAVKEIDKIITEAKNRWPINEMAIYHRTGMLDIGDVPVVIAVSTPHRQQGFEACQFAIDTLKETVPIWKKEIFADGEEWVSAHP